MPLALCVRPRDGFGGSVHTPSTGAGPVHLRVRRGAGRYLSSEPRAPCNAEISRTTDERRSDLRVERRCIWLPLPELRAHVAPGSASSSRDREVMFSRRNQARSQWGTGEPPTPNFDPYTAGKAPQMWAPPPPRISLGASLMETSRLTGFSQSLQISRSECEGRERGGQEGPERRDHHA